MASHVLVVATVTAASDDLLAALRERAARGPVDFLLVMLIASLAPAGGREAARYRGSGNGNSVPCGGGYRSTFSTIETRS